MCGGPGTRLNPITKDMPKSLVPVKGRPILHYIIDYWRSFTDDFVFILNYKKEDIVDFVKTVPIKAKFVEETGAPKGIANALTYAKKAVGDYFILVLGDCICTGSFNFPDDFEQGFGVWKTNDEEMIKQSYLVEAQNNGKIVRVREKPNKIINNLCGTGFYFFKKLVFEYIQKTPPSPPKGQVEITDCIQKMVEGGEKIKAATLCGNYLNLTYPHDLELAGKIL
jgi:dTDP-glucose pyrophosphorylase